MAVASVASALLVGACGSFDVTNPNQPTLDDLVNDPTRGKLSSAATGLLIGGRLDQQALIWRLGSLGREGINLAGNNQPDYSEPYFGPLLGGGFGAAIWGNEYRQLRNINTYLNAVPKAAEIAGPTGLSSAEASASLGYGKTLKALALLWVAMAHGNQGAPVDVDRPVADGPAPFVSEDSVYGYILGQLNDANTDLTTAGSTAFPFPLPAGFTGFNTPATFRYFNRALAAKAYLYRATAANSSCGTQCYTDALAALVDANTGFGFDAAANFAKGVYFDYSANSGDTENGLSDALDGITFFATPILGPLSQKQSGGKDDQRVLDKVAPATRSPFHQVAAIPFEGSLKFTIYLTGGNADPSHPIPVIRSEELLLLRAEANLGLGILPSAVADINTVRTNSGKLPVFAGGTADEVLTELLYNRRYSLLWEQGTTWNDARRFGRIVDGYIVGIGEITGFGTPSVARSQVALRFPIPDTECSARGQASGCSPLGN
jgi:hypothetical protein